MMDDETYGGRRRGGGPSATTVWILTALLTMAAGATGYYAWTLWSAQEKLSDAKSQLTKLSADKQQAHKTAEHLTRERDEKQALLGEATARVRDLEAQLAVVSGRLDELEEQRAAMDSQLQEFRRITKQFQKMIDSGRLDVTFRRGRMIVELPAQVLFPSGSAELTADGKQALHEVARILRTVRGRRFVVAGHTDNVPVSSQQFPNNWHLSTARALRVTEALIASGMRPRQLVAAGHAAYEPVASNKTPRGRQKNRRIEIVLEPKLKPLPGLDPTKASAPKGKRGALAQSAAGEGDSQQQSE